MQRLQAAAGNAAVAAMLGRPPAPAPHSVQRLPGGDCSCGCGSCTSEDLTASAVTNGPSQGEESAVVVARTAATPKRSTVVLESAPSLPGALPVARVEEPAPPTEGDPVTLIGLTHNDGMDQAGNTLARGPLTTLRSVPSDVSGATVIAKFRVNTRVVADRQLGSWYYVVVEKTGQTGYMAKYLVETELPDPHSRFHRIGDQETAFQIVNNRYGVDADAGYNNQRFYANGLVEVNSARHRTGIYEPSDDERKRLQVEEWRRTGRFVYAGAATKANYQIVLPSKDFADTLDVSSGSWVRDIGHKAKEWLKGKIEFAAFFPGLIVGALECLRDTVAGILDLVWSVIKGVFTGFAELRGMFDTLLDFITNANTRRKAAEALADWLEDRWNSRNPAKRGYWQGWITGYLAAEVLLALVSAGETLLAKAAGKMRALYEAVKGTKVVTALEAVASKAAKTPAAVKIRELAGTATKVAGAAAATKPAQVSFMAVRMARGWAASVLKIPKAALDWISDAGVQALRKLSPKAMTALQRLGERGRRGLDTILDLFGCRSRCKFAPTDVEAVDRRLVRMAEADVDAATDAAAAATRAEATATRAAAKAEAAARKAAGRTGTAKNAAAKAEAAKDAAAKAKAAKNAAQQALAAKKAAWLTMKERNVLLGYLHGYRTRSGKQVLNQIEQSELDSLIRGLERSELSADEARKAYDALIAKVRARREHYQPATPLKDAEKHTVSVATGKEMEAIDVKRLRLSDQRATLAAERDKYARSLGVDSENIDDAVIKTLQLRGKVRQAKRLADLDEQYKRLGTRLVRHSEELGIVATRDFAKAKGARPLYEGPSGPGTLDAVFYKPGPPVTLFVCEAKGGSSRLGTRMIGGTAYQQGHPEYLRLMLEKDKGFRAAAEKAGLLKLIDKGEITTEYHLVQATGGTEVLVTQFDLRPRP